MKRQLVLLEDNPTVWRLDDHTREVGRLGIAKAREALRRAEADRAGDDAHRSAA